MNSFLKEEKGNRNKASLPLKLSFLFFLSAWQKFDAKKNFSRRCEEGGREKKETKRPTKTI